MNNTIFEDIVLFAWVPRTKYDFTMENLRNPYFPDPVYEGQVRHSAQIARRGKFKNALN